MTKIGTITHGEEPISYGSPLIQRGRAPASTEFWGTSTCVHTVWETTVRFCMV